MVGWHHQLTEHELEKIQEIVRAEKPGKLQTMQLQKIRHNLTTKQQ